jgi:hypothetical protein
LIAEEKHMISRASKYVNQLLVLACMASIPLALCAQDASQPPAPDASQPVAQAAPQSAVKAYAGDSPSRWDIFAGYSYLHPFSKVKGYYYGEVGGPTQYSRTLDDVDLGAILSGAYYFNRYVGIQAEGAYHHYDSNDSFVTGAGGLILRYPVGRWTPFAHALIGGARTHGNGYIAPYTPGTWSLDVTAGGGFDYELAPHWAFRLAQVDYEFMNPDFGYHYGVNVGTTDIHALRVSTGIVYHIGSVAPPVPVTLACSASPSTVYPGDPVTVTATASGLNPKKKAVYSWMGDGVTGDGPTATVATGTLAPGDYTVKATVTEGSKPWQTANCSANYTVKAFEPPTISCSASPSTINPGDSSTVTAIGVSPQNRPLTYSYSAAAGTITGNGTTATFSSVGAPTGPVGITCNVTDDKGQTATSPTSVTIFAAVPHTQALCSIGFSNDPKRPTRVDNEAKACLDEVDLSLKKDPTAKLVVVGSSNSNEKADVAKQEEAAKKNEKAWVSDPAAVRAVNTKAYLVVEKGVDPTRISVATSTTDGQKVENYLVPEGANFTADVAGTTAVQETAVKPVLHKQAKAAHKKTAKKKAAAPAVK